MFEIILKPHVDPMKFPLADGWGPPLIIVGCYLIFVLKMGRQFMDHRQPYDLRKVLKVYNLVQILYNSMVFIVSTHFIFWKKANNISCLTVMPMDNPLKMTERLLAYAYYINKILDLMDTIFIVLRKSYRQISVLHLLHHVMMVLFSYIYIRYNGYGGQPWSLAYINSFVHSVMYGYYYLSSEYPQIRQSLWWKKYITIIQMVQFLLICLQNAWTYLQPDCPITFITVIPIFSMSLVMIVMFSNFYIQTYIRQTNKKISKKQS